MLRIHGVRHSTREFQNREKNGLNLIEKWVSHVSILGRDKGAKLYIQYELEEGLKRIQGVNFRSGVKVAKGCKTC